jgi:D-3-phosphoglycerate dehydrogenase
MTPLTDLTCPRVLVLDPVHDDALERLRSIYDVRVRLRPPQEEVIELASDVDAIIVRSGVRLPAEVFTENPRLRVVARAGSGVDNIDVEAARAAGVQVFNVPGGSAGAVAELAVGLLLAVMRRISVADRQLRKGVWNKTAFEGDELAGKTLGLIGFGNIGSRIARITSGFAPHVLTAVANPSEARRIELADRGVRLVDLPTLLADSDVICVVVPLTEQTRGLIGAKELAARDVDQIGAGTHRGEVVDELALVSALRDGVIAGAGLDVHNAEGSSSPFADLDNVLLTPHIGAMSADAQRAIGVIVVDSLTAALAGEDAANRVC